MHKIAKTAIALVLSAVLLCGLTACSSSGNPVGSLPTDDAPTAGTTTTTAPTTTTTAPPPMQYNIVTGLEDIPMDASTRPVGIMIANNDAARPQTALDQADLFFEIETEGTITRILAIFGSPDKLPDAINPIRSARTPFVQIAQALDIVYCHAGGSVGADAMLSEIDIANINALYYDGTVFWRDRTLDRRYEYLLTTGWENITKYLDDHGWVQTPKRDMPFDFGTKTGDGVGNTLDVRLSGSERVSFHYDPETNLYTKYFGNADSEEKHTVRDGNAIQVSNVIVMYADRYMESDVHCNFDFSSGSGKVVSGGTSRDMTYSLSPDGFTMYEEDGTKLRLNPGKTYVCVAHTGYRENLYLS